MGSLGAISFRRSLARAGFAAAIVAGWATVPAPALAADSVYWDWSVLRDNSYVDNSGISVANLDGSGGHVLSVTGAPVDHPLGVAIDAARGTIYWANFGNSVNYCNGPLDGGNTISFARPDGTGGGTLNTSGATVSGPDGVAIDRVGGRLYWANDHANTISYASLDGSGGHDLNITGATANCPAGLTVDHAAGRVYWTNYLGNAISYANLNGSGGGDLRTTGATVNKPWGIAIDPGARRAYWSNEDGDKISYANLDGSGGADLNTTGATVDSPWGVAIDPAAGRIYWANNIGHSLSFAKLDGSGGADLSTAGAMSDHPKYPALLEAPRGAGAPVVTGGSATGSMLFCSPGSWAPDLPESFLYRAPQHLAIRWIENGTPIAAGSRSIVASSPGSYACQVGASNYAGSVAQTSATITVTGSPSRALAVSSWNVSPGGAITVGVMVDGPGSLWGRAMFRRRDTPFMGAGSHRAVYGTARLTTTGAGPVTLTITPTPTALRVLMARGKLNVFVALALVRTDGTISRAGLRILVTAPNARAG